MTTAPKFPSVRTVLLPGTLALAICVLLAAPAMAQDKKAAASPKPSLTVTAARPVTSNLPLRLAANGNIAAWQEASIGAEAAGLRLAEVRVGVGDVVQRGQVLAVFASESVAADVAQAKAGVAEAQAMAAEAKGNADRARSIQTEGFFSAQQINQLFSAEQAAQARLESARAVLTVQQIRLKQTQVLAPDSGIISARSASVGAVLGSGTELFRLIRQGRLEWRAEMTSTELGRVKVGTVAQITSASGAQITGKVRMVAPTVDPQTRTALVYVDLGANSTAAGAKAGMFARGEFELGSSGAVTVANTAVVVRDGFSYVYRIGADNRVAQVKVQTGRTLGDQIELLGGVKTDDRLVASGASFLSEGDLVKVVDSKQNTPAAPANTAQPASK
ncbi:MAG: efflux RND transporter periplasmic adaptor subunit [Rhodoferax sp.]|nr:efflux RND transporter periplasmic adaptor subunit [Rhodoferax sp.]